MNTTQETLKTIALLGSLAVGTSLMGGCELTPQGEAFFAGVARDLIVEDYKASFNPYDRANEQGNQPTGNNYSQQRPTHQRDDVVTSLLKKNGVYGKTPIVSYTCRFVKFNDDDKSTMFGANQFVFTSGKLIVYDNILVYLGNNRKDALTIPKGSITSIRYHDGLNDLLEIDTRGSEQWAIPGMELKFDLNGVSEEKVSKVLIRWTEE